MTEGKKKKGWSSWSSNARIGVGCGCFLLALIFGLTISACDSETQKPSTTKTEEPEKETQKVIYDIPSLVDKNIDEVKTVLGTPKSETEPTQQQKDLGFNQGSLMYEKDSQGLLITYNSKTRTITDFFLDGTDKNKLLASGNLSEKNDKYLVEAVQQLDDKSKITGIKASKKLPTELDGTVNYNAVAFQISNNEGYNWSNCRFKLNNKYTFESSTGIKAKDKIEIPFSDFATSDGTRFNLFLQQAQSLGIMCDTNMNKLRNNYFTIK